MTKFIFSPERNAFFRLNDAGSDFGKAIRIRRGDPVTLSDEMAGRVREMFGEHCLRPENAIVIGQGVGAVARVEHDRLRQECEFWRLSALAMSRSAADRKAMAVALGASKNADADAQRAALLSVPSASSIADALDAMSIVAKGWA